MWLGSCIFNAEGDPGDCFVGRVNLPSVFLGPIISESARVIGLMTLGPVAKMFQIKKKKKKMFQIVFLPCSEICVWEDTGLRESCAHPPPVPGLTGA